MTSRKKGDQSTIITTAKLFSKTIMINKTKERITVTTTNLGSMNPLIKLLTNGNLSLQILKALDFE